MTWNLKSYCELKNLGANLGFVGNFKENWRSRFQRRKYGFDYDIPIEALEFNTVEESPDHRYLVINGINVMEWLDKNARGHAFFKMNHSMIIENYDFVTGNPNYLTDELRTSFRVVFSDPAVSMLWKLTFGGKMIDVKPFMYKMK